MGDTGVSRFGEKHRYVTFPLTGLMIDSNAGGYFGLYLKFAGFDALEVTGKAGGKVNHIAISYFFAE